MNNCFPRGFCGKHGVKIDNPVDFRQGNIQGMANLSRYCLRQVTILLLSDMQHLQRAYPGSTW